MSSTFSIRTGNPPLQDVIHLLRQTLWAADRPAEVVAKSMEHSDTIGAYNEAGRCIAIARIITDYATFAYLCDVVVDEAHRGQGISKALMEFIMDLPYIKELRRFSLLTLTAHELYRRYGFTELENPKRYMEIFRG